MDEARQGMYVCALWVTNDSKPGTLAILWGHMGDGLID